jgi:hypothetical protein
MTMERQPARLATLNLRSELDKMINQPAKPEPKTFGLLSSRKKVEEAKEVNDSEASRVLQYMKQIRESMSDGV